MQQKQTVNPLFPTKKLHFSPAQKVKVRKERAKLRWRNGIERYLREQGELLQARSIFHESMRTPLRAVTLAQLFRRPTSYYPEPQPEDYVAARTRADSVGCHVVVVGEEHMTMFEAYDRFPDHMAACFGPDPRGRIDA